jgi:uncharacterized membrane protein YidH (DUF202 family)
MNFELQTMSPNDKIEHHIARTIFGSILIIFLIFFILFNEENKIIQSKIMFGGFYLHELMYWVLILISFLVFFVYVLPSIVFIVQRLIRNNGNSIK